ncbi:universal stress protein [Synechococcus sp. PCC 7336]|uniref:universal stress protein n=1 Tax=Synechococcus sp. PCC 7336 TaxID=195250 RepID=UPI00034A0FF8|nr:universal stress protein [Synechococcus sp. PCC 7336]
MQLFNRILVAVDASGASVRETKALLGLPRYGQTAVTLLHVVPKTQVTERLSGSKEADGRAYLDRAKAELEGFENVTVSDRLEEGDPKTVLLKVADEIDASLTIMGGRSMNRLVAIFKNSVSQYVFQLSTRPLLIVREGLMPSPNINRVMVALDGSQAAQQALKIGMDMIADAVGRELLLIRVLSDRASASYQKVPDNPEKEDEVLATAISTLKNKGVPYRSFYAVGDPGREITLLSGEKGADLLVMGSPDRRPSIAKTLPDLERLLGNSVSDYVRVHAQCPVLMARPQE